MALTKVSGDILDTGIVVAGVVTATSFDGPITGNVTGSATSISGTPDITVRNISGVGATFTGNVSIGGTLTYQDVTNVDSTGIATARVGLDILSGGLNIVGLTTGLHVSGVSTFIGAITGNLTGTASGNPTLANGVDNRVVTATGSNALTGEANLTFNGSQLTVAGKVACDVNSDISMSSSADGQLVVGGNGYTGAISLDAIAMNIYHNSSSRGIIFGINETEKIRINTSGNLKLPDDAKIELGGAQTGAGDLKIYHTAGSHSYIDALGGSSELQLRVNTNELAFVAVPNSSVYLYHNGLDRLITTSTGAEVKSNTGDTELKIKAYNTTSQSRLLFTDSSGIDGNVSYDHNDRKLYLGTAASGGLDGDLVIDASGDIQIGHTGPITAYNSSGRKLTVHAGNGSGGTIELGANTNLDAYNAGTILFYNDNNANATQWQSNSKLVGVIRAETITTDSNAGDDSGADFAFYTKPEAAAGHLSMMVHGEGYVTKPKTPAFHVSRRNGTVSGNNYVIFV